jgi:RNA polymerase sigma factor (sigma-70 family)
MPATPHRPDDRSIYADAFARALRHAAVHVARDEAREIAHHVAVAVLQHVGAASETERTSPVEALRSIDAFVHRLVVNRLRDVLRARQRRTATEEAYFNERTAVAPAWTQPGAALEAEDLRRVIEATIAVMPPATQRVFSLIRRDQRTYKEVAAELGVGVGTVHSHLSHANSMLRQAVADYHAGVPTASLASAKTAGVRR